MKHVFISYKREDELRVARIAHGLEAEGLQVWWDRGLPGGESWHANIETKLQEAGCVVVVWSNASASVEGGFVREEARRGLNLNILVPVSIDRVEQLPLGFGEIQAIDLVRWHGDRRDPYFQDLVATIRAKIANTPLPTPRGPTKRLARRLLWGSVSGTALASAAAIAFNSFGVATGLCTMPGMQPALSDGCGAFGIGKRPSKEERLAWESRAPSSCPALRAHISRFPDGVYRGEAADLLIARKISIQEAWAPAKRTLDLFVPAGAPEKTVDLAHARGMERAKGDSDRLCRGFSAGTLFRYIASSAVAEKWSCSKSGAGMACGFEGHAECELTERQRSEQESCG